MIIPALISILAIFGFGLAIWRTKIIKVATRASESASHGVEAMLDRGLSEESKEAAVQRAALNLIFGAFGILWRLLASIVVAAAPIYLAEALGVASADAVFALMLRVDYIIVVSIAAVAVMELIRRRLWREGKTDESTDSGDGQDNAAGYSKTDRFFHSLAFSSPAVLKTASWCEDLLVKRDLVRIEAPIFITSLARGGTTPLLNALRDVSGVATYLYRDMPFVTAPLLWSRLAGGNRRAVKRQKRAHGDGLEIDLDSPEAFEEILWMMFWREKYGERSISLWSAEDHKPGAQAFMARHKAKLMAARQPNASDHARLELRYCSKNNANIARLALLPALYPDAKIVVPVRQPGSHAASLLRQHQNFEIKQAKDDFVRRYMRDTGHFEFGQLHKPILFPGFTPDLYALTDCNYWLDYWNHAFSYVCDHADRFIVVLQDDLRKAPDARMKSLLSDLQLSGAAPDFSAYFHRAPDLEPDLPFNPALMAQARSVYQELVEYASKSFESDRLAS